MGVWRDFVDLLWRYFCGDSERNQDASIPLALGTEQG